MWPSFPWIQRSAATVRWGNRGFFLILLGHSFYLFTSGDSRWRSRGGKRCIIPPGAQEVVPAESSKPPGKDPGEAEQGNVLTTKLKAGRAVGGGPPEGPYLSELKFNVPLHETDLSVPWWRQTLEPSTPVTNTVGFYFLQPSRTKTIWLVWVPWGSAQLECWWELCGSASSWAGLLTTSQNFLDFCCLMFVLFNGFKIHFTLLLLTLSLDILWIFEAIISRLFLVTFFFCGLFVDSMHTCSLLNVALVSCKLAELMSSGCLLVDSFS